MLAGGNLDARPHNGYALREGAAHDLRLLHDRFGIGYPDEVADLLFGSVGIGRAAPHDPAIGG